MTMKLGVQEEPAIYKVLLETAGGARNAISDLVVSNVAQTIPIGSGEFDYIDIGSVNNLTKQIEAPKRLPCSEAPSRARQRVQAGDVLVSMTRPNLNAVALVPHALNGATASTGFHVLRAGTTAEPAWLFYAVQSPQFVGAMSELVQGALYPAVRPKDIRAFSLFVPPKVAQREVVAYLDEQLSRLDASVAALHRVQANLKRYRASVLKSACEGRLVPTEAELARQEGRSFETGAELLQRILAERKRAWMGKRSYVEPDPVASEEQAPVPDGWAWAALDELAWHSSYGTSAKCSPTATGAAVLRIPNVDRGNIDTTNMKYSAETLDAESTAALKAGDMLIIRTNGSKALIGRGAIVQAPFSAPTTFASYLIRFRLVREIHQEWLGLFWQSPESRGWIEARASTSAGQHNVSMSVLATAPVPLPPLAEQHRIVAEADRRLSLVRVAEAQVSANLARAQRLRQSILQAAFTMPAQAGQ